MRRTLGLLAVLAIAGSVIQAEAAVHLRSRAMRHRVERAGRLHPLDT
ncbi:MAG: hypothetical protein WB297_10555 [Actinomycetota bacterium]